MSVCIQSRSRNQFRSTADAAGSYGGPRLNVATSNNRYVSSLSSIVIVGLIAVQCEKNRFSFFSLSKIIMLLDADSEYRSCNYLLEISLDIDRYSSSENNGR